MTKEEYIEEHGDYEQDMYSHTFPDCCPVCGSEWEEIYIDNFGDVAGCDSCVRRVNWYDV